MSIIFYKFIHTGFEGTNCDVFNPNIPDNATLLQAIVNATNLLLGLDPTTANAYLASFLQAKLDLTSRGTSGRSSQTSTGRNSQRASNNRQTYRQGRVNDEDLFRLANALFRINGRNSTFTTIEIQNETEMTTAGMLYIFL